MTLREYGSHDVEAMYRLDRVCFDEAFRFSRRAMRSFAEGRSAVCVVAEAGTAEVVGFAIGERDGEVLYLVTLDVAPEYRRLGLGRRMLRWLEDRTEGVRWVALHVFAGNAGAQAFYEREGFHCVANGADFYGRGMDALVYRRRSGSSS